MFVPAAQSLLCATAQCDRELFVEAWPRFLQMRSRMRCKPILFIALAGCAQLADSTSESQVSGQRPFQGIYVLGNETLNTLDDTAKPFVDGFVLRTAWRTLDQGGPGHYDFSLIAEALAGLNGKNLSLTIDAQLVPQYVLDAAETTYYTTVPNDPEPELTAVTWDANTLGSYRTFMTNLANTPVCLSGLTCAPGSMVALKNHPALAGLRINIIGMGKIRQDGTKGPGTRS